MTDTTVEEGPEETVEQTVERIRPLSATMARQLTKLVENDFMSLRNEVKQIHEEATDARIEEIRAEVTPDSLADIKRAAQDLFVNYQRACDDLIQQAQENGITLSIPQVSAYDKIRVSSDEVERRVSEVQFQSAAELRTAMNLLKRQELQACRQVLIAAITSDAEKILNTIPNAQEALATAIRERADRQVAIEQQGGGTAT